MNYFWWTANLGVVPLLRFAALRFAPILRCLALRRASVTAVRDAINDSLIQKISLMVIVLIPLVVKEVCAAQQEDFIIARGEQREIEVNGLKNYSIGNKEVITTTLHNGKLLVKGRQVGYSDLVIWQKGTKKHLSVYVLSKTTFLKTIQLSESLKDLGLKLNLKGPIMVVSGIVETIETWKYLLHLKAMHKDKVVFQIEASDELKRLIAKNIYSELFSHHLTKVSCLFHFLAINCSLEADLKTNQELLQKITKEWGVTFVAKVSRYQIGNLRLKLKLIQIENSSGREINFGLSAIRANVSDLFSGGLQKIISDNEIVLAENDLHMSTLAEPESLIQLNKPHEIEVGAQIPFQNVRQTQGFVIAPIDWRFAGLRVVTKLTENSGQLNLDFETEFSRPAGEGISGSKEKSSLQIQTGQVYKIFQIGYKSYGNDKKFLPGLKNIPILNTLFGSRSSQNSYKRIEGYVVLEEEE